MRKTKSTRRQLERELGRPPSGAEIAETMGESADKVELALRSVPRLESLDIPAVENGTPKWAFRADQGAGSPWRSIVNRDVSEKVRKAISTLPARHQLIVRLRYGIGFDSEHKLEEIGNALSLTRERVRQLESDALKRLFGAALQRGLKGLLEK